MRKIRFVMVGCGAVADLYLPVFKHLAEAELAALLDVREEVAKHGAAKIYTDVRDASKDLKKNDWRDVTDDPSDAAMRTDPDERSMSVVRHRVRTN